MPSRQALVFVLVATVTMVVSPARARPMTAAQADAALKEATAELEVALSASGLDCATACTALASMRRAADRLCALEPGPRCEAARTRVEQARKRVAASCPECSEVRDRRNVGPNEPTPKTPPKPDAEPKDKPVPPREFTDDDDSIAEEDGDQSDEKPRAQKHRERQAGEATAEPVTLAGDAPASPPAPESSRGGCAACTVGASSDGSGEPVGKGLISLLMGIAALALRRRRT